VKLDQSQYFPESAIPHLTVLCEPEDFLFNVKKSRSSKLGDFRYPVNGSLPKISVNADLNQYHFLLTFLHELAHYFVWKNYKSKSAPHGKEWKNEFSRLLIDYCKLKSFPESIEKIILKHALNPKASSFADINLMLAMNKFNATSSVLHLYELEKDAKFRLKNGRVYIKGDKRRSRILCKSETNNRQYLIHLMAEVLPVY
jgi:SprT protein